ncbi:MAG: DEAD/DEAH box helicase [Cyanobacteria bacterium HKST-UBA04]|nr:DEAD/DEAH box helicase [Cyanobacteria bacterium HKST-UBA04]MCA9841902.1 DEAD/DEAH box helicase [Cyanobacteria bacterium HKST-UBA03]
MTTPSDTSGSSDQSGSDQPKRPRRRRRSGSRRSSGGESTAIATATTAESPSSDTPSRRSRSRRSGSDTERPEGHSRRSRGDGRSGSGSGNRGGRGRGDAPPRDTVRVSDEVINPIDYTTFENFKLIEQDTDEEGLLIGLPFSKLPLSDGLHDTLVRLGFDTATPIQSQTIPPLMKGQDVLGLAQTGTGKTAAFVIPILEHLQHRMKGPHHVEGIHAVILCPTRELALQVTDAAKELGQHLHGLHVLAIYGGQPIHKQFNALKRHPQILVATPGRLLDHLDRGTISLHTIHTIVLDEADEMLNMGFLPDIEAILKATPLKRQTACFSATMPHGILHLTRRYQTDPVTVKIEDEEVNTDLIDQSYVLIGTQPKWYTLKETLDATPCEQALIFCNTQRRVDSVVRNLQHADYTADGLHGGMSQPQRDRVMKRFRNGDVHLLVATDVAARGIDVDTIDLVINFDFPEEAAVYTHRIGRTGRAGREGTAISFVEGRELPVLQAVRRLMNQEIPEVSKKKPT